MRPYFITAFLFLSTIAAQAQRICETEEYSKNYFALKSQRVTPQENSVPPRDTVSNEIITIPVVVHVLFNSAEQNISVAQVLSQINVLNSDFRFLNSDKSLIPEAFKSAAADARIMFCLAKVDANGRSTNGIDRKYSSKAYFMADDGMKFKAQGGADAWDSKRYLNIWVCRLFGRTLGYATPPGGDATKDGVVISYNVFGTQGNVRSDFNKGRTATHEVAHWLGLKHIWGDDYCGDDGIGDTPPQKSYNFNCPAFPRISNCAPGTTGDMFMNYMDLTSDACMNMFTTGQKNKMRSLFALQGSRNSLLRSYQCDGSLASEGPLPEDTIPVVPLADVISVYPNPVVDFVTVQ
ncbi:MAG: zinc metalloprotease, partial [Gloeobacteraceae cyanobacterium ES-bin-316]|nr:zinc metalloprotease [Ferruginibacter sp.]